MLLSRYISKSLAVLSTHMLELIKFVNSVPYSWLINHFTILVRSKLSS